MTRAALTARTDDDVRLTADDALEGAASHMAGAMRLLATARGVATGLSCDRARLICDDVETALEGLSARVDRLRRELRRAERNVGE